MTSVELALEIPMTWCKRTLRPQAEAAGLLSPDAILWLIRQEIRQRRVEHLFVATDCLVALDAPTMSGAAVAAEIDAARGRSV